ncbi:MAG TPA: YegS/Rv2252/BmrU family lipid kinase [Cellvibrionaceae bacterium]|nr:YegS/Rv2252/BmrU family lipid kinase [Cellvibrionaceae bacterium]HMW46683.1 YegS/Rv2252/BmrU family lipid kinase [Cellvibrionaceae bacterium]HMW70581.1 YegS/Rv2252/BmrU family lipid kinase [Cellvibrionaceae bacterium]HNG58509.1 YegS/Rv2252/BmrU family lipid kinase [Cellvibrionaceae bacterium]
MKPASAVLIVNKKARSGAELDIAMCLAILQAGGISAHVFSLGEDELWQLDEWMAEADVLIVAGGDGSINHNLTRVIEAGKVLAIIPMGTANDFARNLGVPNDARLACELIVAGNVAQLDVASVNGHHFVNVAHIGLGVSVTYELNDEVKKRWGILSYLRAFISALKRMRTFRAKLQLDGRYKRYRLLHLSVGCGRFYGGGNVVDEHCYANNGWLNITGLRKRSLFKLLISLPFIRFGRHRLISEAIVAKAKRLELTTRRPMEIHADGEPVGFTPAVFELQRKALRVIYNVQEHHLMLSDA